MTLKKARKTVGWREWVSLPDLHLRKIKVKVDTGAKTSALHATHMVFFKKGKKNFVKFRIYPEQRNNEKYKVVESEYFERRKVKSSTGTETHRPVILTTIKVGSEEFEAEVTLVDRDMMGFRMLLGRQALRGRFLVDSGQSHLQSKDKK